MRLTPALRGAQPEHGLDMVKQAHRPNHCNVDDGRSGAGMFGPRAGVGERGKDKMKGHVGPWLKDCGENIGGWP